MAGFLGFGNYAKPGQGVGKDEPQKNSFVVFFEIYIRKFWKLIEINILFFLFCIPFFIPYIITSLIFSKITVITFISLIPVIGVAAITPGLTYILRNYARQEHAFIWSDFIENIKKNLKQSLTIGIIDFSVYALMIFSVYFYHYQIKENSFYYVPFIISIVFTLIFTFMQYYIFVMLVTFELTTKQLLKNALIFSIAGLGRNIIITFFCGLLAIAVYLLSPISYLFVPFILISTVGFIIVFNSWPLINKLLMPNSGDESQDEEVIFKDIGREKK